MENTLFQHQIEPNRTLSTDLDQICHKSLIPQKQILALFHFEKPTRWPNGARDGVDAISLIS